ncbi:MAG: adenosylcobinamide-phosphate synthase CbiB [Alistipes sp.]|nr:adenosylcobinamide-phosphate synthase CbiB [Alistipes sp.]
MFYGSIIAVFIGLILDLIFGDPYCFPHLVRLMGRTITLLEKVLRKEKDEPGTQFRKGIFMAAVMIVLYGVLSIIFLALCYRYNRTAGILAESFICWQMLAATSLRKESMKVYHSLRAGDVEQARHDVSMIVGRDTEKLDKEGIIRGAVETVAENTSDGVIAPLFYMIVGGGGLAMAYKAVNTMDSMVGYRSEKYLYFGRAAARIDDVVNYIPARLSAVFMLISAFLLRLDHKNALRIFWRDRYRHKSPNSAQTESVCAGALDVRLGGGAWYFGVWYEKPYIGDDIRQINTEDIKTANKLMITTAILAFAVFMAAKTAAGYFLV